MSKSSFQACHNCESAPPFVIYCLVFFPKILILEKYRKYVPKLFGCINARIHIWQLSSANSGAWPFFSSRYETLWDSSSLTQSLIFSAWSFYALLILFGRCLFIICWSPSERLLTSFHLIVQLQSIDSEVSKECWDHLVDLPATQAIQSLPVITLSSAPSCLLVKVLVFQRYSGPGCFSGRSWIKKWLFSPYQHYSFITHHCNAQWPHTESCRSYSPIWKGTYS